LLGRRRFLHRFHFALNDGGCLFLGRAEILLSQNAGFAPLAMKRRLFTKIPRPNHRDRYWFIRPGNDGGAPPVNHLRVREAAFDAAPTPQLVVDLHGLPVLANSPARALFNLSAQDVGRPVQDLELSYRPPELRPSIDQAAREGRPVTLPEVEWRGASGEPGYFTIQVMPLLDAAGGVAAVSVSYADVTQHRRLQEELQRSNRELESAYEGLQSTVEELETTNEELQSTVEELETMNEEPRQRRDELNQVNGFLESILTSLRNGVVLDRELQVLIWNRQSEELWVLRAEEVRGKHFMNLDIGLPVEQLRGPIRACLTGESVSPDHQAAASPATNRRGRAIQCRGTCTPLRRAGGEVRGAILLMEEQPAEKAG
jgi:two-component system CheB/CheR fusion protein